MSVSVNATESAEPIVVFDEIAGNEIDRGETEEEELDAEDAEDEDAEDEDVEDAEDAEDVEDTEDVEASEDAEDVESDESTTIFSDEPLESIEVLREEQQEDEDTPLARVLTFSDYQKWSSSWTNDWDFLQPQLTEILEAAADDGASPDYFLFGGDFSCLNSASESEEGMRQVLSIVQSQFPNLNDDDMVLLQGNHDPADTSGMASTGAYYFDDFIIYAVNEDDFPTKQGDESVLTTVQKTASDLESWLEGRIAEGEKRPILIASHTGLHYDIDRRDGNNQYAYVLFDAINEAAKQLDIVFLFGHNHTNGDEQVGGSLTFYRKGQKLNVCTETSISEKSGTPYTLNFNYMNYGYVGYIGDIYNQPTEFTPTDVLTCSILSIYNDRIEVSRYSRDGLLDSYTNTVSRYHSESTDADKYTVTYDAAGGSAPVSVEEIAEGSYIICRTAPTKAEQIFEGWATDTGMVYNPGDEINVTSNITLTAKWAELPDGKKYILADTIKPGKKYILVYNSDISGNNGTKYAVHDSGNGINVTKLPDSSFLNDNSILILREDDESSYTWDAIWNQGENPVKQAYLFQNVGTHRFIGDVDNSLVLSDDPVGTEFKDSTTYSSLFSSYSWLYKNNGGYNELVPYDDSTSFIRYSVSKANVQFGSTSVSTDVNNSNVYLYEEYNEASDLWVKVDKLESNNEYIIVNSSEQGGAKALTTTGRTIGSIDVDIVEDSQTGLIYVRHEAESDGVEVFHSYGLGDGTTWLDGYDLPSLGGVLRLDSNRIGVTSNHADNNYYSRFKYEDGKLKAYRAVAMTDGDTRTMTYSGGFNVDNGTDVYLFKRVDTQLEESLKPSEEPKDDDAPYARVLTFSDYQLWNDDETKTDWDKLQLQLKNILNNVIEAGASPDYFLFGGDYSSLYLDASSQDGLNQVVAITRDMFSNLNDDNTVLIQGNHDPAYISGLSKTGPYYFDDCIIYAINEDDFPVIYEGKSTLSTVEQTSSDLKKWLEARIDEGETRPIFIATHVGLHYDIDRLSNEYAYVLFDAINEAAKQLDIIFLFGHNHTNGDEQVGGSLTFYGKGEKLNISTEDSATLNKGIPYTINFNYMNYGYIGYVGDIYNNPSDIKPTDALACSILSIYDDRIVVDRYGENGLIESYTTTVTRYNATHTDEPVTKYKVTYDADGGTSLVAYDEIVEGTYVVCRTAPTKTGKTFEGWLDNKGNIYNPGDEIIVSEDITLTAQWEDLPEGKKYILVDTIKPGKKYILVYNSDISGNNGVKHAVTDNGTGISVTTLSNSKFLENNTIILLPESVDESSYVWDAIWNEGYNPVRHAYLFQNIKTKRYLGDVDNALVASDDPIGTELNSTNTYSELFSSYSWLYKNNSGYNELVPYKDSSRFIRYSVSGENVQLGYYLNNSNVYLYEQYDDGGNIWVETDKLESNNDYIIVSSNKVGNAKVLTTTGRDIGNIDVVIEKDSDTSLNYIEHEASYDAVEVFHSYGLDDGTFWLDSYDTPSSGGILRLDTNSLGVTSSHAESYYYNRFIYQDGKLIAYKGLDGTETRTMVYNNGFLVGDGSDVSIFKRVKSLKAEENISTEAPILLAKFDFEQDLDGIFYSGDSIATSAGTYEIVKRESGGNALYLDGTSNAYLNVTKSDGTSLLTGYDAITISYDTYVTGSSPNWGFYIAPNGNTQKGGQEHYMGAYQSTTSVTVERYNNHGSRPGNIKGAYSSGWHHIDVVFDLDETFLYIDGALMASSVNDYSVADILGDNSIIQIGKANWGSKGEFYVGYLDNLEIYASALGENQIVQNYKNAHDLNTAIEKAEQLSKGDYTVESWKALEEALEAAKQLTMDSSVDEADRTIAAEKLNALLKNLEIKPIASTIAGNTGLDKNQDQEISDSPSDQIPTNNIDSTTTSTQETISGSVSGTSSGYTVENANEAVSNSSPKTGENSNLLFAMLLVYIIISFSVLAIRIKRK
jgi:uncharacterized repeat protein (TIGR02543 family)